MCPPSCVCVRLCVSVQTGANPIHGAAMNGHAGAVRVLTRSGCNIDQQRKVRGMTVVRGHGVANSSNKKLLLSTATCLCQHVSCVALAFLHCYIFVYLFLPCPSPALPFPPLPLPRLPLTLFFVGWLDSPPSRCLEWPHQRSS